MATASSNRSASRLRAAKRNSLSRMTAHEASEARASPIITSFTTQSARRNRFRNVKDSGVTWASKGEAPAAVGVGRV
jgi:ABC-type multidrug transport system fused ATPase/permease subunit